MTSIKAVATERLDLFGKVHGYLLIDAPTHGSLYEFIQLRFDELSVLLPYGLSEHVCFAEREACQLRCNPHHLLLIDNHAIRRGKDLF